MERFFPLFLLKMENGMEWNGMEWNGNGTRFADLWGGGVTPGKYGALKIIFQ